MNVTVRVIEGPHQGLEFTTDHSTLVVGRATDAQISLPDDHFLSRHHFLIEVNPPLCFFRDLGSTNGTRVNEVRVEHLRLQHGDIITAGQSGFVVQVDLSRVREVFCRGCGTLAPPDVTISARPDESTIDWYCQPCAAHRCQFPDPPAGYWIERRIGGGGMGNVYLARRDVDHRPVAIKVMVPVIAASSRAKEYFLREMNVLKNLRHKNIVAFYKMVENDGQFQLIMEYVDGRNAREWVRNLPGPLSISAAARLGVQLLRALDHAHSRGYVHRDIKPSNLLVMGTTHRPFVKLSDFGLAKNFRDEGGFVGLTVEGDFGGSIGFVSPDHLRGFGDVKEPADIYSAGATLYYLLTNQFPFLNFDPRSAEAFPMTLEHPSVPLRAHRPDAPEGLERVLRRALEKRPKDRWPSAAAMANALRPFRKHDGEDSPSSLIHPSA